MDNSMEGFDLDLSPLQKFKFSSILDCKHNGLRHLRLSMRWVSMDTLQNCTTIMLYQAEPGSYLCHTNFKANILPLALRASQC